MKIIKNENGNAMMRSGIILTVLGILLFLMGYAFGNDATAASGIGLSIMSLVCLGFIVKERMLVAKIIWGVGFPLLLFFSLCFFSLSNPTSVYTYSYLYIGGLLYVTYSFFEEKEKGYLWLSIAFFFMGILSYDQIIIRNNFKGTPFAISFQENYINFKVPQIIHFISILYLIRLAHKSKIKIEDELSSQIKKFQIFTSNLIFTSKNKIIHSGNLHKALEEILISTAQVMDVSRIGVWEIDEESHLLNLVVGYDVLTKTFSYDAQLDYNQYSDYYKYLLEEKIIIANDVYTNHKTIEFSDSYTRPLGIKSLMDSPFFMDGKFKGILCCEEQRHYKKWDEMDQLFSMSISKLISIAYYCCYKKAHYETVDAVNKKMEEINGVLANDIIWKEKGIQELKEFIDEMSFKNAHHVRGPLSRMLGLLHLYKMDQDAANREKYIDYLQASALELDEIVKDVSFILSQKGE
jgi:hypothetical protein